MRDGEEHCDAAREPTKDFELELRLRNNQLKQRRLALGLSTHAVSEQIGISYTTYVAFESMTRNPLKKSSTPDAPEWRDSALRIAAFYGIAPEVLWTDAVLAVRMPRITRTVDGGALMAISSGSISQWLLGSGESPSDAYDTTEVAFNIKKAILRLPFRQQQVLY